MKHAIRIVLNDDTMAFLAHCQGIRTTEHISDFINSLIRQERFRQGYSVWPGPALSEQSAPARLSLEDTGVLSFPRSRRR